LERPDLRYKWTGEKETSNTALWAVADGVGGENCGELASLLAVKELSESLSELRSVSDLKKWNDLIIAGVSHINEIIINFNTKMASTLAVLLVGHRHAQVFNLGDSSVFLLRDDDLRLLTMRHTVADQLQKLGVLFPADDKTYPQRNQLTRYLGMAEEGLIMIPDAGPLMELKTGDIFLVCTDGLTDALADKEISDILHAASDPIDKSCSLVQAALDMGSRDNISVIVVEINTEDLEIKNG